METDCNFYFLSTSAIKFWKLNDLNGQNKMFECLSGTHKVSWFKRVIFRTSHIPEYRLNELAENVFLSTWETFNKNGWAGKLTFTSVTYTGYFFTAFKGNYIKALEKEIKLAIAEKSFQAQQPMEADQELETQENIFFSFKTQDIFNKIGSSCSELLKWRYIEDLSHDEIAKRKNIKRESSIKTTSRCKQRFLEIWGNI